MSYNLIEGKSYAMPLEAVNQSTRGGMPSAATVTIVITAETPLRQIVVWERTVSMPAGGTFSDAIQLNIPPDSMGEQGILEAKVLTPVRTEIAKTQSDFLIVPSYEYVMSIVDANPELLALTIFQQQTAAATGVNPNTGALLSVPILPSPTPPPSYIPITDFYAKYQISIPGVSGYQGYVEMYNPAWQFLYFTDSSYSKRWGEVRYSTPYISPTYGELSPEVYGLESRFAQYTYGFLSGMYISGRPVTEAESNAIASCAASKVSLATVSETELTNVLLGCIKSVLGVDVPFWAESIAGRWVYYR